MPYKDPIKRREASKQSGKKWRAVASNREREAAARRRRYKVNPKKGRQATAKWRREHPDYSRQCSIQYKSRYPEKARYIHLVSKAKGRGLECSLSFDDYLSLISGHPCYYCGGDLPITGHGTDRINSKVGYVVGNVRPCCVDCNTAKSDKTDLEFRVWALRLTNHWAMKE